MDLESPWPVLIGQFQGLGLLKDGQNPLKGELPVLQTRRMSQEWDMERRSPRSRLAFSSKKDAVCSSLQLVQKANVMDMIRFKVNIGGDGLVYACYDFVMKELKVVKVFRSGTMDDVAGRELLLSSLSEIEGRKAILRI